MDRSLKLKQIFFTFLIFFFTINMFSQFGVRKKKVSQIEQIKNRVLLVVLTNVDKPFFKKLDVNLKKAIESEWTFSDSYKFVSNTEYDELIKNNPEDYAVLKYSIQNMTGNVPGGCLVIGLAEERILTHYLKIVEFDINNKFNELDYGRNPPYIDNNLSLGDVYFGIQRLQYDLKSSSDYKSKKKQNAKLFSPLNSEQLEGKTLFVDKALLSKKFKEDISKLYNFDYKLVSQEEIDNAITEKLPNTIYFRYIDNVSIPVTRTHSSDITKPTDKTGAMTGPFNTNVSLGFSLYVYGLYATDIEVPLFFVRPKMKNKGLEAKDFKSITK